MKEYIMNIFITYFAWNCIMALLGCDKISDFIITTILFVIGWFFIELISRLFFKASIINDNIMLTNKKLKQSKKKTKKTKDYIDDLIDKNGNK